MVMATEPTSPSLTDGQIQPTKGQGNLILDYVALVLAAIAGTGGGKTQLGYWWLDNRLTTYPGYAWGLAEPTYQMLEKIILNSPDPDRPDLMTYLARRGFQPRYKAQAHIIETNCGKIYVGSADRPNTMQGAAVRGYWLDEAGMMSLTAYETALQRVSMLEGQVLLTTTPYDLGWLKLEIFDKADGDELHVETWRSIDRPGFPVKRYDAMKRRMSKRRFAMMFDAQFEKPEGLIYSAFNDEKCIIDAFKIPKTWPCYVGMDFGGVNTAAIWYAQNPRDGNLYCYREYLEGEKTAGVHGADLKKLSKGEMIRRRSGGAPSEVQWRREFAAAGWNVGQPYIPDVEIGIDRVQHFHEENKIYYFRTCSGIIGEKTSYRRKLDKNNEVTEEIEDKRKYHRLDAERYIIGDLSQRSQYAFDV